MVYSLRHVIVKTSKHICLEQYRKVCCCYLSLCHSFWENVYSLISRHTATWWLRPVFSSQVKSLLVVTLNVKVGRRIQQSPSFPRCRYIVDAQTRCAAWCDCFARFLLQRHAIPNCYVGRYPPVGLLLWNLKKKLVSKSARPGVSSPILRFQGPASSFRFIMLFQLVLESNQLAASGHLRFLSHISALRADVAFCWYQAFKFEMLQYRYVYFININMCHVGIASSNKWQLEHNVAYTNNNWWQALS